ncbi:hypothetical protein V2G26_014394 [Clonostachys chloroleuca]
MGDPEPFDNGPLSDPGDMKGNRRTQDWKFPSLTPGPAPPDPQAFRFPAMPEEADPAPSPVTGRPLFFIGLRSRYLLLHTITISPRRLRLITERLQGALLTLT